MKYIFRILFFITVLLTIKIVSYFLYSSNFYIEDDLKKLQLAQVQSVSESLKTCGSISSHSFQRGLTDGAFSPFGRSYYLRDSCFFDLARRSYNEDHCRQISSIKSESECLDMVKQIFLSNQVAAEKTKKMIQLKEKLFQIKVMSSEYQSVQKNWLLHLQLYGEQFGNYTITVKNNRADFRDEQSTIYSENIQIGAATKKEMKLIIPWSDLRKCKGCDILPPAIIPIAVSIYYRDGSESSSDQILVNISNTTLNYEK